VKLKQICNHPSQYLKLTTLEKHHSAKLQRLEEMLDEVLVEEDRALIFTQFAEWGKLLKPYLEKKLGREIFFLYGSTSKKQREEMIEHHVYDPYRLDDYLSQYDLFYIPSTVKQSKQENSESHGSPAKIPDIENLDANSPEKVKRPSASERTPLSPLKDAKRKRGGTRRKTTRRRRKN
jgi:hypothetical protein